MKQRKKKPTSLDEQSVMMGLALIKSVMMS